MNNDVPIIYLFLYRKIKENWRGNIIPITELLIIFRNTLFHIPRLVKDKIILEMEDYKLISRIDCKKYKILKTNKDQLLNNYNNLIL